MIGVGAEGGQSCLDETVVDAIVHEAQHILQSLGGSFTFQLALEQLAFQIFNPGRKGVDTQSLSVQEKQWFPKLVQQLKELVELENRLRPKELDSPHHSMNLLQQRQLHRRMLLSSINDIRVAVLWLTFRLAQLRCVAKDILTVSKPWLEQSLSLHAGLANRLSLWQLKWELEDLSFRLLKPAEYHTIAKALEEKRTQRSLFIDHATGQIKKNLAKYHVKAEVKGRPKHIYSIYKKMQGKQKTLDEVYDLRAIRVMVDTPAECYTALGVVHDLWVPIPKEFDDYIAVPKPNGYQSLHTVVLAEDQRPLEIQIRTHEMHLYAEFGVAAHWHYKEANAKQAYAGKAVLSSAEGARRLSWVREILDWDESFSDEKTANTEQPLIYVFTPAGEVVELDQGATPIDFAYAVHTQLGHRCRGAKVDGHLAALDTALKTGQTVEITASKQTDAGPSRDWLNLDAGFVKTTRAKMRIRSWFHAQQIDELKTHGRSILEKELQRLGKTSLALQQVAQTCGFSQLDDFLLALAREEFSTKQIQDVLIPHVKTGSSLSKVEQVVLEKVQYRSRSDSFSKKMKQGTLQSVLVHGLDGVHTQMAQCCKPIPPDPLLGFVARGKGVSVHRKSCKNIQMLAQRYADRVVDVEWAQSLLDNDGVTLLAKERSRQVKESANNQHVLYLTALRVYTKEQADVFKQLVDLMAKCQINLKSYQQKMVRGRVSDQMLELIVWVKHRGDVEIFSSEIRKINGVIRVDLG
jgi:GTP pyrophosphokinase